MTSASLSRRQWLLSERPQSRMQARLGRAYMTWRQFSANRLAVVGLGIIIALLVVAAFADVLAPYPFDIGDLRGSSLKPPSWEHWMGTDDQGRDILSRIIYGSRLTLYVVVLVAILAAPIGLLVGTVAGYSGGWVDTILMRITDIFLAFPKLILALAFVAALGSGHRERGYRHRHNLVAALRTYRAGRNDDRAQVRLHRRRAPHGRFAGAHRHPPYHAALHLVAYRACYARHGWHHHHRRGSRLPWPWRTAAVAGMGRDDRVRVAGSCSTSGGCRQCPAWRS